MKDVQTKKPRVLVVTPEVTYLPSGMGNGIALPAAKAGGLADVSAALIAALFEQGADVHVAIPAYRTIYDFKPPSSLRRGINSVRNSVPCDRVHLARDRSFFFLNRVYTDRRPKNTRVATAFQREVINNIIPMVQPELIHCHDWMTGLIPAAARQVGIPCLFTVHNIHSEKSTLAEIEDRGVDAAGFWQNLFYEWMPGTYEEIRDNCPVDFLASGIFGADFVNTLSQTFLEEVIQGRHPSIPAHIRKELTKKAEAGRAAGILNAPDSSFHPSRDPFLEHRYEPRSQGAGKKANKRTIQKRLGLIPDERAPLFFWPSRLDPVQKGCQLLAEIFYKVISRYWPQNLQVVFVADGIYQQVFKDIVGFHGFQDRVAVCDYDEKLSRLAYAASDFVLMPSSFEPCGLPQMIGMRYGSIPIAHDAGGLHDTIQPLDVKNELGNGFLFRRHNPNSLFWAVEQAMHLYNSPPRVKNRCIERIMRQSSGMFNHAATARRYAAVYEKLLRRPLTGREYQTDLYTAGHKFGRTAFAAFDSLKTRSNDYLRDNKQRVAVSLKKRRSQGSAV